MAWYALRDLTRSNSKSPAWERLSELGFRVYTPMTWRVRRRMGRQERYRTPVIHDLLFVESDRESLDPIVNRIPTLQYRYRKGGAYCDPMTVRSEEMERFIEATSSDPAPRYYSPAEVTASMRGRKVRIIGGQLNGYTGHLLSIRGLRTRRLIIELTGMLTAAVEVSPDLIEFI